jgi:hypothetical protein
MKGLALLLDLLLDNRKLFAAASREIIHLCLQGLVLGHQQLDLPFQSGHSLRDIVLLHSSGNLRQNGGLQSGFELLQTI